MHFLGFIKNRDGMIYLDTSGACCGVSINTSFGIFFESHEIFSNNSIDNVVVKAQNLEIHTF